MTAFKEFSRAAPLVLVGAGKMGSALLKGWLDCGLDPEAVVAIDPAPPEDSRRFLAEAGIAPLAAPPLNVAAAGVAPIVPPPAGAAARVIVVAVKPQTIATVLPGLRPLLGDDTLTVSIAAGTTLGKLAAGLGDTAIVRAMPNTPAQVGRGITGLVANRRVDRRQHALAEELLTAVGEVVWVADEGMIDAVTAVSGSGPAYVFLLAECLAEAAVAVGLPRDVAERLARATVTGSAELLHQSELAPAKLRENVTSPHGTTAAALDVLMSAEGMAALIKSAVTAAKRRSEELAR
jgi:pyrroline-5-carboxylate reductase